MRNSLSVFLENLNKYPSCDKIAEASDYAQDKATEYAQSIDINAVVTVEDGEISVKWEINDEDGELAANVQSAFDEAFGAKIEEMGFTEYAGEDTISIINNTFYTFTPAEQQAIRNACVNADIDTVYTQYVPEKAENIFHFYADEDFLEYAFSMDNDADGSIQFFDRN